MAASDFSEKVHENQNNIVPRGKFRSYFPTAHLWPQSLYWRIRLRYRCRSESLLSWTSAGYPGLGRQPTDISERRMSSWLVRRCSTGNKCEWGSSRNIEDPYNYVWYQRKKWISNLHPTGLLCASRFAENIRWDRWREWWRSICRLSWPLVRRSQQSTSFHSVETPQPRVFYLEQVWTWVSISRKEGI